MSLSKPSLKFQICNHGGTWGFCCNFCDFFFFLISLNREILDCHATCSMLGACIYFDCFFCFQLQKKELQSIILLSQHFSLSPGNCIVFLPGHATITSWQWVTILLLFEAWGFQTVRNASLAASFRYLTFSWVKKQFIFAVYWKQSGGYLYRKVSGRDMDL